MAATGRELIHIGIRDNRYFQEQWGKNGEA